jgi:hypothetical protein
VEKRRTRRFLEYRDADQEDTVENLIIDTNDSSKSPPHIQSGRKAQDSVGGMDDSSLQ